MNKYNRRIIINTIYLVIITIFSWFLFFTYSGSDDRSSFLLGFASSITLICLIALYRFIKMKKNPEYLKKNYIKDNDERSMLLAYKAGALTFRIITLATALFCVYEAVHDNELAIYLGYVVCATMIIYLVIYYIYNNIQ